MLNVGVAGGSHYTLGKGFLMHSPRRIIEAVALDMDGLSLNTEELYGESGQILMARRGKLFRDEIRRAMTGLPAPEAFAVLSDAEGLVETWQELLAETEAILSELLPQRVQPMPGLLRLLDVLDDLGMPRCIATSSTHRFAKEALTLADIYDRIGFVVTAEDVAQGKPAPDIYLLAAARMRCPPEQVLVLEDSPTGSKSGVAAGCQVIAIPSSHVQGGNFEGTMHQLDRLDAPEILSLLTRST